MHRLRSSVLILILVLLSCSPLKNYMELPEVTAWEPEIVKFEQLDRTTTYPDDAVLFAGSSSIRLWSTLAEDMAPYNVIQRGYGGAKLSDFAVYADRIFSPHKCSAAVLFIANDITGNEGDKTPEEVKKLFIEVLKTFRKTHPETSLFYIAVTPTSLRWKAWPEISKANDLIREVCEIQRNTYFIKTDFAFLDEKGRPDDALFLSDKLHLNAQGYKIWTKIIREEMDKVLLKIIAHRGASYVAPENTVASAKLAWEAGADAVECDIWLTKDKKLICCHDETTKRTTGQDFKISETDSKILRKLDAGLYKDKKYTGEKIPFLKELIKTVPSGKELVIELKFKSEALPFLKKEIDKYSKNRNFTFICFDFQTIADTRKLFPEKPCYWLCSNAALLEANFDKVRVENLDGVSLSYSIINESVMKKAESLHLEVYSWTVDNPEEAKRLINLGVKGITTNRPGWLNEQIFQ